MKGKKKLQIRAIILTMHLHLLKVVGKYEEGKYLGVCAHAHVHDCVCAYLFKRKGMCNRKSMPVLF